MDFFVWQRTCIDESGNVLPDASVAVTDVVSGALAQLYSDEGVTLTGNPIDADEDGFVRFFVKSGIYTIVATLDADSRTWTKEAIGAPFKRTAAEIAADVTPVTYQYPQGDIRRYGDNEEPGTTDMTGAFLAAFSLGGDIYVPVDTYLIAGTGADSGGVDVEILSSTRVYCEAGATFVTDSLDNDFIRFTVPSDGDGLPADGIEFEWHGGTFDQRDQKNSTVVPFISEHPPANQGASATCDALSIRGDYTVASVEYHGIKRALVEGVTFIAGDHWESAGGDSGLFVGGCAKQIVRDCRAIGSRDLAVYCSGSTTGTLDCDSLIENCQAINCFGAFNIKRSSGDSKILNNTAHNCVRGFAIDWVDGGGFNRVRVSGNTGSNLGIMVRMQAVDGFDVSDNHCTTLGALLEDGSSVEEDAGCNGIELHGCRKGTVRGNTVIGLQSGISTAYPSDFALIENASYTRDATTVDTQNVMFLHNVGDGLRSAANDGGVSNSFIDNYVMNATSASYVTALGTNSFELRVDPSTMARGYTNPVGFADGTTSLPAIARRAQTSLGIRFGASLIGLTMSGTDSIRADNSSTAGNTRMLVYDVDNATVERVTVGAADSGGSGFKVLRIPN